MKTVRIQGFETSDGRKFVDEEAAKKHEDRLQKDKPEQSVAGKTVDQLVAAINGSDPALAAAVEILGRRCSDARRARGEMKVRGAKPSKPAEPAAPADPAPSDVAPVA